jgi:MYXO-CTERM domain-containing protein
VGAPSGQTSKPGGAAMSAGNAPSAGCALAGAAPGGSLAGLGLALVGLALARRRSRLRS